MAAFITKDSGARMEFASGMKRDTDAGKIRWHLLFSGPMLRRWAELLTRGAEKYEEDNWMKARGEAELKRFRASAARHFASWMNGEMDEDHGAAVMFNINGAEYVKEKIANDTCERQSENIAKSNTRACTGGLFSSNTAGSKPGTAGIQTVS